MLHISHSTFSKAESSVSFVKKTYFRFCSLGFRMGSLQWQRGFCSVSPSPKVLPCQEPVKNILAIPWLSVDPALATQPARLRTDPRSWYSPGRSCGSLLPGGKVAIETRAPYRCLHHTGSRAEGVLCAGSAPLSLVFKE